MKTGNGINDFQNLPAHYPFMSYGHISHLVKLSSIYRKGFFLIIGCIKYSNLNEIYFIGVGAGGTRQAAADVSFCPHPRFYTTSIQKSIVVKIQGIPQSRKISTHVVTLVGVDN